MSFWNVSTISGDTPSHTRQEIVDDFQAGNIGVLICNTVAAKEGITLTRADTVLFLERGGLLLTRNRQRTECIVLDKRASMYTLSTCHAKGQLMNTLTESSSPREQ